MSGRSLREPETLLVSLTSEARSTGLEPVTSGVTGGEGASPRVPNASQSVQTLAATEAHRAGSDSGNRPTVPIVAAFPLLFAASLLHSPGRVEREFLSVRQVAQRLGVSRATVYGLVANGGLRGVRLGRVIRVWSGDLGQFPKKPG